MYQSRDTDREISSGGRYVQWKSNRTILPYATICREWEPAATLVLYQSVVVVGERAADRFLETVRNRPDLAGMVRALVVGLSLAMEDEANDGHGQAAASAKLVEVIDKCPNILHLQVRPLQSSVRATLIPAVRSKALLSLVVSPRLPRGDWDELLYSANFDLILPTLTGLELDIRFNHHRIVTPRLPLPTIPITKLSIRAELQQECVFDLIIAAGPTLEHVDLYQERLLSIEDTADALMTCVNSVKTLQYCSNPTLDELERFDDDAVPLFDRVLRHFTRLTSLSVSSTNISSNLFRILPPSLVALRVQAFNDRSLLGFGNTLMTALADPSLTIHLRELVIVDTTELWGGEANINAVAVACAARGIDFEFKDDSIMTDEVDDI
ncbi:hypothetical protein MNV49_002605 [Pseudohyphozyma bogoriensis]|nr:hypothetical protein MNV49_002605 [Pseudohyphozyma bogoriensis]